MVSKTLFSSKTIEWETPQDLFDKLDTDFDFYVDLAASPTNKKCKLYIGKEANSLNISWAKYHPRWLWCNPPYGREIGKWIEKAHQESRLGAKIVMLLPARTDTKWFHDYIYKKYTVRFLKGRLKFGGSKNTAPFPSMIVVFQ